jgi:1,4-dihydroxy-2-naphthoyl-CoA hydrolase
MKPIWFREINLDEVNATSNNTLVSHLGIVVTEIGDNYFVGTMPVDHRTVQPYRLLHGGASCVLAETLGSVAANFTIDPSTSMAVGQHIEATHLKSATKGLVTGKAFPIHLGKSSQTWRIEIYNEEGNLLCDSKLIMAIVKKR